MRSLFAVAALLLTETAALVPVAPPIPGSTLSTLDVPAVLRALAGHCRTEPGARVCESGPQAVTAKEARANYAAVAEAMALEPKHRPPLRHPLALGPVLRALEDPEPLDAPSLSDLGGAVASLTELAEWSRDPDAQQRCALLASAASAAEPPARLASALSGAFVEERDGPPRLSPRRFPALGIRRAAVAHAEAAVAKEAARLSKDASFTAQLADPTQPPQLREGRLVVAVQPQNKKAVG